MSDLSRLIDNKSETLQIEIAELKRGGSKDDPKPHKPLMLLAIIDLLDEGKLQTNRMYFNEALIQSFERNFRHYSSLDDWCQPGLPFFHLRSSNFWNHRVKSGREEQYAKLTTSGGGTKRIRDNIEYAYFSDDAWEAFSNPECRGKLRVFLAHLLDSEFPEWNKKTMKSPTLLDEPNRINNIYFHESFPYHRQQVLQALRKFETAPENIDLRSGPKRKDYLREDGGTDLGTRQAKPISYYAFGAGLVSQDFRLTPFGLKLLSHDPLQDTQNSQWLIHYHLSAAHGPGPLFWHELVRRFLRVSNEFSASEIISELSSLMLKTKGKVIAEKTIERTKTAFISSYVTPDGLNNLEILDPIDDDRYLVLEPDPPSVWVFGLALLDFWEARYGFDRLTINLEDLTAPGGLADIFLIGAGRVNQYLRRLQEEGYVEVFRLAPPYQVVLRHHDPEPLLEKLYAFDNDEA